MNVYDRSGKLVTRDYEKKTANIAENSKAAKARADAMSAQWEQERARREAEKQQEKARKEAEARARKEAAEREKVRKATEEFNRKAQEAAKAQQEEQRRQQAKQNMQSIPALKRVDTVNGFNMPSIQQDNTALNQGPISLPTIDPDAKNRIIPRDVNVRENSLPVALQNNYKIATETDLDKQIQSYLSAGKLTKEQKKEAKNVLKQELARRREFARANKGDLDKLSEMMTPGTDEYKRAQNYDDLNAKVNSNFGYGLVSPFAKISDLALKGIEKLTGTEDSQGAEVMNQQMRDFYNRNKLAAEQAPIAHGVGNFVGQAGIYSATNPLFDAGAEAVGVTSNLGKFAVNQLAQNAQDLALDTAPTYNQNISMGMSEDEAKKEALKGMAANAVGNLVMGAGAEAARRIIPGLRAGQGADAVNQIDDQIQTLQRQSDDATAEIHRLSNEVPEVAEAPVDVPKLEGPAEAPVNTLNDITPERVANSPIEAGVVSEVDNPAQGNMKVSKARSNTLENSGLLTEAELDQKFSPDKFMYEEIGEKESMLEGARLRQAEGDAFVQNRLNKEGFTSADTDGMMQAYTDKVAEARALEAAGENADDLWDEANTIFRKIQREGTRGGQAIQALAKWSRNTPEGILVEAEQIVNSKISKPGVKDGISKSVKDKLAKAADAKAVKKSEALFSNFTDRLRQSIDASGYEGNDLAIRNLDKAIDKFDNAVRKGDIGEIKEAYGAITGRIKRMGKKGLTNDASLSEVKEAIDNLAKTSRVEGFTFSPEFQRQFIEEASKLQDLDPDSREFKEAYARLGKQVGEEIRRNTPGGKRAVQMLTTYLMDNMLGNFRTLITRNAGGNVGLNALEQLATRPVAATLDRLVSLKTGKRTQAGTTLSALGDYGSGFIKGLKEEGQDFAKGLHTARSGEVNIKNAIDSNGHIFGTDSKNPVVKAMSAFADKADGLVRHGLSVGDRPFYEAVYKQTLGDLNRFREKGQLGDAIQSLSDADFKQLAEATAKLNGLTAVYQNDSRFSKALLGFKQSISDLSQGALGVDILSQFTMPFVKTPANVIDRAIDYSPLGLVRNAIRTAGEGKQNFNQNRFVNETARNLIGTGLMGGAGVAAEKAILSGKFSDDADEKQAQRNRGMQEYALNLPRLNENDPQRQMDISWIPVVGSNAVAAAAAVNAANDPQMSNVNKVLSGGQAGGQALFNQSMFQGLQRLFGQGDSYNSDANIVGNMTNTVKQGVTQFVPSLARQAAQVADPLQRDLSNGNYDVNTVKNTIPGLRETLQPRVDSEGNYIQENQGRRIGSKILEDMILPGKITEIKDIPLDTEAQRLQALTGENKSYQPKAKISEITTDDHTPTPEEYTQYQVDRNHAMTTVGNKLINTEYYKSLSPTDQEEMLSKAYSGVKDYMQSQYTDHELATAAGKAYAQNGSDGAVGKLVADKLMDDNNITKGSRFAKQVNEIVNSGNVDGAKELIDLYNDVKDKATTKSKSGKDDQKKADLMREILALPEDKQAAMYDAFGSDVCSTNKEKAAYEKGGAEAAINEYRRAQAEAERKAAKDAAERKKDATDAGVSVTQLDTLQKQLADAGAINSPDTVKYYNHAKQTIPSLTVKEYTNNVRRIGGADMKVSQKDMLNYLNTNNVGAEEGMKYWNTYISGKKLPRLTNGKWTSYTPK